MSNKFGLSRSIPAALKRQVRLSCGFGCAICGNAIYQYEHIVPSFADARGHDPDAITLLCGACHDKVTHGIWSKAKVLEAAKDPFAIRQGHSGFHLDIGGESEVAVRIGQTTFRAMQDIILIDGQRILSVDAPEQRGSPPRLSAMFYDRRNRLAARIVENEWQGRTEAFDIEIVGNKATIRSALYAIDLVLVLEPPQGVAVERLHLYHNGKTIAGDSTGGFRVETDRAAVAIPAEPIVLDRAPYWVHLKNRAVLLGSTQVIQLVDPAKAAPLADAPVEVIGARIEQENPPGGSPSGRAFKMTKLTDVGEPAEVRIHVPVIRPSAPPASSTNPYAPPRWAGKKIGRNDPCPCGSGKKYKRCHGAT